MLSVRWLSEYLKGNVQPKTIILSLSTQHHGDEQFGDFLVDFAQIKPTDAA